ncbi:hypothetical protein SD10_16210 [Spirosoma radiotolerans]|uniref:Uncharacterized protein n=1 Tax=Spirosoma radiotolerans TaxID=1379870 RepID=A0A0E3ZX71_9BACT|nr:hypothetical protein SD10_16210 [Spirosoma radiotolerans]
MSFNVKFGPTFRPHNTFLTNKVLSSSIIQKKFLLSGKAFRMKLNKFIVPFSVPGWLSALKQAGIYFLLKQILLKLHLSIFMYF